MLTEERFAKILALVDQNGSSTVQELMLALNASESTIRRDLNLLDRKGELSKVRGGAISKKYDTKDDEVLLRKERNIEEKTAVARYAASLIQKEDFVYIDAGTTTEWMIDFITNKEAIYVTNAVGHAKKLAQAGCTVYIPGGEFKNTTEAIVGEDAVTSLEKYNFTKGFFGTNGITVKNGFTTPEIKEAIVKKVAMENSKQAYVLADETKFGKISSVCFGAFEDAVIITNRLSQKSLESYKNIVEVMKE